MSYERGMNVTVRDLKDILKDLPDEMEVIVPITNAYNPNDVFGFYRIRTAGVLKSPAEQDMALCLAPSLGGWDIYSLVNNSKNVAATVEKMLF